MALPDAAVIEIIERTDSPDPKVIVPNEIRINGRPVLAPADYPVEVHEISIDSSDAVRVTLTLFAKRVTIGAEAKAVWQYGDAAGRSPSEVAEVLASAKDGK